MTKTYGRGKRIAEAPVAGGDGDAGAAQPRRGRSRAGNAATAAKAAAEKPLDAVAEDGDMFLTPPKQDQRPRSPSPVDSLDLPDVPVGPQGSPDPQAQDAQRGSPGRRQEAQPAQQAPSPGRSQEAQGETAATTRTIKRRKRTRVPRSFPCPDCDKVFPVRCLLLYHSGIHEDPMPYPCDDCHRSFPVEHLLVKHYKKHFKYKPYRCEKCGKAYRYKASRKAHLRDFHSDEPLYKCTYCGEAFVYTIQRWLHVLRIHEADTQKAKDYFAKTAPKSSRPV